jgi:hypothetical protein
MHPPSSHGVGGGGQSMFKFEMHFNVKGFKIITLHSNSQNVLQLFTKILDISRFVINMEII